MFLILYIFYNINFIYGKIFKITLINNMILRLSLNFWSSIHRYKLLIIFYLLKMNVFEFTYIYYILQNQRIKEKIN